MHRGYDVQPSLGFFSLSGKTSYCQTSWGIDTARLDVIMIVSLWNLTSIFAALSNFRAIKKIWIWILLLRDFTISCGKASSRVVNKGPGSWRTRVFCPMYSLLLSLCTVYNIVLQCSIALGAQSKYLAVVLTRTEVLYKDLFRGQVSTTNP